MHIFKPGSFCINMMRSVPIKLDASGLLRKGKNEIKFNAARGQFTSLRTNVGWVEKGVTFADPSSPENQSLDKLLENARYDWGSVQLGVDLALCIVYGFVGFVDIICGFFAWIACEFNFLDSKHLGSNSRLMSRFIEFVGNSSLISSDKQAGTRLLSYWNTIPFAKKMNYFTAACHAIAFFVFLIVYSEIMTKRSIGFRRAKLQILSPCWDVTVDPNNNATVFLNSVDLNPRPVQTPALEFIAMAVIFFHLISFVFQFVNVQRWEFLSWIIPHDEKNQRITWESSLLEDRPQRFRYLEYSLSAALLASAMVVGYGVQEVWHIIFVFFLVFAVMIFGLLADVLRYYGLNKQIKFLLNWAIFAHVVSWILFFIPWILLFSLLIFYQNESDANSSSKTCPAINPNTSAGKLPDFVYSIVITQLVLWTFFGIVQRKQFLRYGIRWFVKNVSKSADDIIMVNEDPTSTGPRKDLLGVSPTLIQHIGVRTELEFIILSFVAKILLGCIAFTQVLLAECNNADCT